MACSYNKATGIEQIYITCTVIINKYNYKAISLDEIQFIPRNCQQIHDPHSFTYFRTYIFFICKIITILRVALSYFIFIAHFLDNRLYFKTMIIFSAVQYILINTFVTFFDAKWACCTTFRDLNKIDSLSPVLHVVHPA